MKETDWGALRAQRHALARTISEIDTLDNEISREVLEINELLTSLKFGFSLEHQYYAQTWDEDDKEHEDDPESREIFYKSIAWTKVERGRWGLVHRDWSSEDPAPPTEKEFKSCAREVRLNVARQLPALVEMIFAKIAESVEERKSVRANLAQLKSVLGDE